METLSGIQICDGVPPQSCGVWTLNWISCGNLTKYSTDLAISDLSSTSSLVDEMSDEQDSDPGVFNWNMEDGARAGVPEVKGGTGCSSLELQRNECKSSVFENGVTSAMAKDISSSNGASDEKVMRRREQNRKAAKLCRRRKKQRAETSLKEYQDLHSQNTELEYTVRQLQNQKETLEKLLNEHSASGSCLLLGPTASISEILEDVLPSSDSISAFLGDVLPSSESISAMTGDVLPSGDSISAIINDVLPSSDSSSPLYSISSDLSVPINVMTSSAVLSGTNQPEVANCKILPSIDDMRFAS